MQLLIRFCMCMAMLSYTAIAFTQDRELIRGVVMEEARNGKMTPVELVHVYWSGTQQGVFTDSTGYFEIPRRGGTEAGNNRPQLVVSYVSYQPDTISVSDQSYVSIVLKGNTVLEEVEVVHRKRTSEVSFLEPALMEKISQDELFKAACCNLSESFETNASVDVTFSDAISGARQIQMLGLAGKYSMLSQEFMPGIRGLAIPYGLLYTPGAWVESMQVTKGAGSVTNGYESMTGQINVELKKPRSREKLFLNAYLNEAQRTELNAVTAFDLNPELSGAFLAHGSYIPRTFDHNDDGFADQPEGTLLAFANRWKFNSQKGALRGQVNFRYTREDKIGGETGFDPDAPAGRYGVERFAEHLSFWGKTGLVFPLKRYQSIGFQWALSRFDQDATFGNRRYDGTQKTAYANLMFQSIIGNTSHKYKAGISLLVDSYQEKFGNTPLSRDESAVGAFAEYTYSTSDKVTTVAGLRADYNNLFGTLITPRLHLRYAATDKTVLRASAGKGYRSANVIAENLSLLASSREIVIQGSDSGTPMGLEIESSWNFGVSLSQEFVFDFRPGQVIVDFFRTTFQDQVVVDLDKDPQQAIISNLNGRSFSNSMQVEFSYEVLKRLNVKMAYRHLNVETDFSVGRMQNPLTPEDRGFLNAAYTTRRRVRGHWVFDATLQITGSQRIPTTAGNPEDLQLPDHSPAFATVNAQVTRHFGSGIELYAGVENLTNFRQENAILAEGDPFGPYFDSGLIWGPVFGRKVYFGVRYILNATE